MTFQLSDSDRSHMAKVHPRLFQVVKLAATLSTQALCITGTGGARTAEEQHAIFLTGASQMDGYKSKSNHQITPDGYGHAVDLVPLVGGKPVWDDTWALHYPIASAMSLASRQLQTPIVWGGNWYERMDSYGFTLADLEAAVARYKAKHPGPDFLDAPHFQLAA